MTNTRKIGIACLVVPPVLLMMAIFFTFGQSFFRALGEISEYDKMLGILAKICDVGSAIATPVITLAFILGLPLGLYLVLRKERENEGINKSTDRGWRIAAVVFSLGFLLLIAMIIVLVAVTGGA